MRGACLTMEDEMGWWSGGTWWGSICQAQNGPSRRLVLPLIVSCPLRPLFTSAVD